MKIRIISAIAVALMLVGCSNGNKTVATGEQHGGPQIGGPAMGGGERPAPTGELKVLIDEVVPSFRQLVYVNEKGDSLQYNLFTPKGIKEGEKYPLVLFMADASTPGPNPLTPLIQGYGGLVWATPEFQQSHPCYVLVPQYSYITVDNEWQTMPEVDETIQLLKYIVSEKQVDERRLYTTGQSMGCMMSLYFNIKYPDIFAASMFVSGQWDVAKMEGFKDKKFVYITAQGDHESTGGATKLKELLKKEDAAYVEATWSARLPQAEQDSLASDLLAQNCPRNFITFEGNTVLPVDSKIPANAPGAVHMASFNHAYLLKPVCDWLFNQSK